MWYNTHKQTPFTCLEVVLLPGWMVCASAGTSIWWNYDWLHMTPGAVGCALSHRAIWQELARSEKEDWWLVLEDARLHWSLSAPTKIELRRLCQDDILWVADDLEEQIHQVIRQLPEGWHLCYLGWHGQSVLHLALGDHGLRLEMSSEIELEDLHRGWRLVTCLILQCVLFMSLFDLKLSDVNGTFLKSKKWPVKKGLQCNMVPWAPLLIWSNALELNGSCATLFHCAGAMLSSGL